LTTFGEYSIDYIAKEQNTPSSNSGSSGSYTITVIDNIAPEVIFSSECVKTVKKGEIVVIPEFTVTDNLTVQENIVVERIVRNANGRVWALDSKEDSFKCDFVGEYELRFVFMDEVGNTTMKIFIIEVTE
jgi:hypothetical protein